MIKTLNSRYSIEHPIYPRPDNHIQNIDCYLRSRHEQFHRPWMSRYAALHHSIVAGTVTDHQRKYVVWTCGAYGSCSGWANRVLGIISALMFAILTDRAFFIEWPSQGPLALEEFVFSDYIDWRIPPCFAQERTPYSHGSKLISWSLVDYPDPPKDGHELRRHFRKAIQYWAA